MPLFRPTALRSVQSTLRSSAARMTARATPARTQFVAKRFSSSGGGHGGHGEASSDLPWLLGALAFTPPACWYLWPDAPSDHGHGHGHGDDAHHGKEHAEEESQDEPSKEEEQASGGEEEAVEKADEKKEDKPAVEDKAGKEEKSEDKKEEKSEDTKEEGKSEEKEDAEKKSETKAGERDFTVGGGDEKKPESVGSGSSSTTTGQKLAESTSKAAPSGPISSSVGSMERKQAGMSNTDTKHSIPIDSSTEKSTKGDGSPETSKAKGTVDPKAPIVGQDS